MKKPSLRFRQVFEHPTHFKVTKPLGNPLIIAKKGLTPSLENRLRKFAQGGEVKGYYDGGSVDDEFNMLPPSMDVSAKTQMARENELKGFMDTFSGSGGDAPLEDPTLLPLPEPEPIAAPAVPVTAPVVSPAVPVAQPVTVVVAPAPAPAAAVAPAQQVAQEKPVAPAPAVAPAAVTTAPAKEPAAVVTPPAAPMTFDERSAARSAELQALQQQIPAAEKASREEADRLYREQLKIAQDAIDRTTSAQTEALRKYEEAERTQQPFFESLGTGRSIATGVSLVLGAIAAGITGTPNKALATLDKAMDKEIERQKEKRTSLFKRYLDAGLDVRQAEMMFKAMGNTVFANKLRAASEGVNNIKTRVEILKQADAMDRNAINLQNKAAVDAATVGLKAAQAEKAIRETAEIGKITPYQQESIKGQKASLAEMTRHHKATEALSGRGLALKEKPETSEDMAPEMGTEIPAPLRRLKPEALVKHRVEYIDPFTQDRKVGFLQDPAQRKDFDARSEGFATVLSQAQKVQDWIKSHPRGILTELSPSKIQQERDAMEPLIKTMVEGYVKNVTGIRRASTAAIKYMENVAKNPAELQNLVSLILGGQTARYNQIIDEIQKGDAIIKSHYLMGGLSEKQIDQSMPARPMGTRAGE